ncbi:MAG: hypothetical protein ACP5XB_26275 [Isosphaeraceae bacterium]
MTKKLHSDLAARLRQVRDDLYGEHGAQFMADRLGIPLKTWLNCEAGVGMSGRLVLKLIVESNVNPRWLLDGQGPRYSRCPPDAGQECPAY